MDRLRTKLDKKDCQISNVYSKCKKLYKALVLVHSIECVEAREAIFDSTIKAGDKCIAIKEEITGLLMEEKSILVGILVEQGHTLDEIDAMVKEEMDSGH